MEKREIRSVSKDEAKAFAVSVVEEKLLCKVNSIKYIGGGSFGFVYLAEIEKAPKKLVMKAYRTGGMCENEAAALHKLQNAL